MSIRTIPYIKTSRRVYDRRLNMREAIEANQAEVISVLRRRLAKRQISQEEFDKKIFDIQNPNASLRSKNK